MSKETSEKNSLVQQYDIINGNKVVIQFIGPDFKNRRVRRILNTSILDLIEEFEEAISHDVSKHPADSSEIEVEIHDLSKIDLIKAFIKTYLENEAFSAKELTRYLRTEIDQEFGDSTVSTYLSRLSKDDYLLRKGSQGKYKYQATDKLRNDVKKLPEIVITN